MSSAQVPAANTLEPGFDVPWKTVAAICVLVAVFLLLIHLVTTLITRVKQLQTELQKVKYIDALCRMNVCLESATSTRSKWRENGFALDCLVTSLEELVKSSVKHIALLNDKKICLDRRLTKKETELAQLKNEKKKLQARLAETDNELREATKTINMLKKKADEQEQEALFKERHRELKAQLDDANKMVAALEAEVDCKLKCSICTDKEVDTVFHCGHTSCAGCIENWMLRSDQCPACKKKIGYRKKLFLGS